MTKKTLVEKLRIIKDLKTGDPWPLEILGESTNNWGHAVSKLCGEAADRIDFLERMSGAVTQGETFQQIKNQARSQSSGESNNCEQDEGA